MYKVRAILQTTAALCFLFLGIHAHANSIGIGPEVGKVTIECARSSSLVLISITNHRKIGTVSIEIRDTTGRSLYYEEGKAMTEELVRRLDKGLFPPGEATLTVRSRDVSVSQTFFVQ